MTPRAEADRAAFEKWAKDHGYNVSWERISAEEPCWYSVLDTRIAWQAWQAASARTPSASGWASAIEAAAKVIEMQFKGMFCQDSPGQAAEAQSSLAAAIRALPPAAAMEDSAPK